MRKLVNESNIEILFILFIVSYYTYLYFNNYPFINNAASKNTFVKYFKFDYLKFIGD